MEEGNISEWNEGSLKSIRLHDAQKMINYAKLKILERNEFGSGFNYNLWIDNIIILLKECKSKYNTTESNETEKIQTLIKTLLKYKPPYIQVYRASISGTKITYVLNKDNWENLEKIADLFEDSVKLYNDKHGFSTKNKSRTQGLFG